MTQVAKDKHPYSKCKVVLRHCTHTGEKWEGGGGGGGKEKK
jgi:hypothetical protein